MSRTHQRSRRRSKPAAIIKQLLTIAVAGTITSASIAAEPTWYPSKFGADDTLGAINLLDHKNVLRAIGLIKTGKVYSLALETNRDTPAYEPRKYSISITKSPEPTGKNQITYLDDQLTTHVGIGTQIDGLGHVGINSVHYNGVPLETFYSQSGLKKFGTHKLPPIVTRGILLDMAAYFDVEMVPEGTGYNKKEILGALKRQNLAIETGDVVIFHSGWHRLLGVDNKRWIAAHPGPGEEGAHFLATQGVVAVGADAPALEVIPFEDADRPLIVHQTLLVKHGVYILESLNTTELAADKVNEFMFVLGVPKLAGSVQGIIHPVAIH